MRRGLQYAERECDHGPGRFNAKPFAEVCARGGDNTATPSYFLDEAVESDVRTIAQRARQRIDD